MTDKEIIMALGCCLDGLCFKCPLVKDNACRINLLKATINLLNCQQEEIAEYQKHIDNDIIYVKRVKCQAVKEFSDVLKKEISNKKYTYVTDTNYSKTVNSVLSSCICTIYRCANEFTFNYEFNNLK